MAESDIRVVDSPANQTVQEAGTEVGHQAGVTECRMVGIREKVTDTTVESPNDRDTENSWTGMTPCLSISFPLLIFSSFLAKLILQIVNPGLMSRTEW